MASRESKKKKKKEKKQYTLKGAIDSDFRLKLKILS